MKFIWYVLMASSTLIKFAVPVLLAGSLLLGCGGGKVESGATGPALRVAVSILPQAYFVERVAGDKASVEVLIPPGSSPHTYELTPRQMADLAETDVLFVAGVPFEDALLPRLKKIYPQLRIVPSGAAIPLRTSEAVASTHDDHHHANDPHTWLSPRYAIIHATTIARELMALDTADAPEFQRNLDSLTNDLQRLDTEITRLLHGLSGRRMYVYHAAWGYLTDAYGLIQMPIEAEGKEPGSRQLAELVDQARADRVRAIFVQKQYASQSPEVIAEAVGARIVIIDPLAYDYVDNLRMIAGEVRGALGDERSK